MGDSLRDQLLKAGLKPSAKPVPPARAVQASTNTAKPAAADTRDRSAQRQARRDVGTPRRAQQHPPRGGDAEIDLARAYALRHAQEQREKAAAERLAAEKARLRKAQRDEARSLIEGKTLNKPDAELMRHFEYGGKIRRVHVDDTQLRALNAGMLGVVQIDGRYYLVERGIAEAVQARAPQHVALLPEPGAAEDDEALAAPPAAE
jgi:uncharacterized protein YaiL (DUF2058 family)